MSHEKEILEALKPVASRIESLGLDRDKEVYAAWLEQTYFFVCHSLPLLGVAMAHSENQDFIRRSREHVKEESGHDKVALADLKNLGLSPSDLKEWKWTRSFTSRQYALAQERGEYLLGYILALEGLAIMSAPILSPLVDTYGIKSSRFVKIHVEEDQEHLPLAIEQTFQMDCKEEILANFHQTLEEYGDFIGLLNQMKQKQAA